MNNLLSYCGLTDAKMRASEKDLPVQNVEETCLWKIIISSANVRGYVDNFQDSNFKFHII